MSARMHTCAHSNARCVHVAEYVWRVCSGVTKIVTEVEIRKIVNLYDCVTGVGG